MKYTFSDWLNSNLPAEGPPDNLIAELPMPPKFRNYHPAWGKGGPSAEKAVSTRNRNLYETAKDTFRREVLPKVRDGLDAESLYDTGLDLRDPELVRASGYQFYALKQERRGNWLAPNDPRIPAALAMGAAPIEPEEYFAEWKPATV